MPTRLASRSKRALRTRPSPVRRGQFGSVTGARFGTAGFNTLRNPGIRNMDLDIFRNFKVTERVGVQFRGEALNISNTPQLGGPSSNISSLRTDPNGNFLGRDGLVQRTFRLGLKVSF